MSNQHQNDFFSGPFCTHRQMHFTGGNAPLCDICLSVCHISFVYSGRKFIFFGEVTATLVNGGVILRSNAQRSMSL